MANDELKKIFDEIKELENKPIDMNEVDEQLQMRMKSIAEIRETVAVAQEKGAQKMLSGNNKQINTLQVGDIVLFRVLSIDRGPSDATNLLCYILKKKHDLFQLVSRAGCLINSQSKESYYPWNTFIKTKLVSDFDLCDVPQVAAEKIGNKVCFGPWPLKAVTVREAVTQLSLGHGQGFIKCACKGQCKQASRCSCRAAGIACGSKCHGKEYLCSNDKDAPSVFDDVESGNLNDADNGDEAISNKRKRARKD